MALNLSAFGIKDTESLNLSAFGISPQTKAPMPSFSDIVGSQDFRVAQTTPMITEEKGMARLPFGKEPSIIPSGKIPALAVSLFTSLPEMILKTGVRALAQAKESGFLAKGEATPAGYVVKPEPLDLSFGDIGKRFGFDSNKIQSVGNSFMEDFTKRQQQNPEDFTDKTFYKNFALAYGKNVLFPIIDAVGAGSVGTTIAKTLLKATTNDPIVQFLIKELRIKPSEISDPEVLRYAANRQWETIIGRGGSKEELNNLGQAVEYVLNKISGGEEIQGLDKLGEIVQKTARTFLSDMSLVTNKLPMGLSIEDISKQLPSKITEAGKLIEQIKQAGGDIQKAQGIASEIAKATSLSVADNLLGQIKNLATKELPIELKPLVEQSYKMDLTKEQFLEEFNKGLTEQNLTKRETVQKIVNSIETKLNQTPEQFYDTYVAKTLEPIAQEVITPAKIEGLPKAQEIMSQLPKSASELSPYNPVVSQPLNNAKITPAKINKLISPPAEKITRGEDVLLRERFRNQARGAKIAVQEYKKAQALFDKINKEITAEINKPRALQRSAISFVKQLGEFNQTAMNEIKKELQIEKPINQMNLGELKDFIAKLKERLKFKFEKGYRPSVETKEKLNLKETPKSKLNEVDYEKNQQISKENKSTIKKDIAKTIKKTGEGLEKVLTPISTRLGNIDISLKYAMRKMEYEALTSIQKDEKAVEPYLKHLKKISKDDFIDLDLALKNGDIEKINEINKRYGAEKEFNEIRETLDGLYKRANQVGFDIGYQKDYWPRMIKDTQGFLEYLGKQEYWSILNEAIERKQMDLGRLLSQEEKANLVNTMIRGYKGGQITLSKTGSMKERVIDLVTPELNVFYYDSPASLVKYIKEVDDKIAARKFFGKGNKDEGFNNIDDSIGAYTVDLLAKGKITPKQELELRNILNARFNPRGTHGIVGLYKNLAYITVMGSPLNAITQLGDQTWAIYRAGIYRTIKADVRGVLGKSAITKESLGIESNKIAQEFSDNGRMSKAVNKIFELTGLNKMDRLGKEALVKGAIEKYQSLAKNPPLDFLKKLDDIFGNETNQVLIDLKGGEITENVKLLAFNELLDFHPVALSEMPEKYLTSGNGRILYMLKSYTLKQFDIFRREAFQEMKKGNWGKGVKNLLYLAFLVVLTNGVADEIKDLLTKRKTKLSDRVVDQLAMLAGFSRYNLGKVSEVGLGSALLKTITPPTNLVDNISKDLIAMYKDFDKSSKINQLRTIQDIPLVGKFYYWWFGKGSDIKKTNERKGIPSFKTKGGAMPSFKF